MMFAYEEIWKIYVAGYTHNACIGKLGSIRLEASKYPINDKSC